MVYLIGSLENDNIPNIASNLRSAGYDVFDDWFAAGPDADKAWRRYEERRSRSYIEALEGKAAKHVFQFDDEHLQACDMAVLALPAGRSGHLEFGIVRGAKKPGFILLNPADAAPKWDVMYRYATAVCANVPTLLDAMRKETMKREMYATLGPPPPAPANTLVRKP